MLWNVFKNLLMLGLHVAIFFTDFLRMIPQRTTTVFFVPCTCCDFFHSSLLMIRSRGKNEAYQDPLFRLNSVPPCGMWTQLCLILVVLFPIFTHVMAILCAQAVCSQKRAEKRSQWSTWAQPHLFQCDLLLLWNQPQILAEKNHV